MSRWVIRSITLCTLSILTTACGLSSPYQKALDDLRVLANQRTAHQQSTATGSGTMDGGVAITGKGGAPSPVVTWKAVNTGLDPKMMVYALALDPQVPTTLYAGTARGVFKSTNSGESWSAVNIGLGRETKVSALVIDPKIPSTLYAAVGGDSFGVFKSMNSGASWNAVNTGLEKVVGIHTLAVDPQNSSTIYAGGTGGGVFKSVNGGASWSLANVGLTGDSTYKAVMALAIDPQAPSTVYVGLGHDFTSDRYQNAWGVFKSVNGGESWSKLETSSDAGSALALDPRDSSTVYAGTSRGVLKSTNGGTSWSWSNTGEFSGDVRALAIDPLVPSTVYAMSSGGVVMSTNGGANWSPVNTGLTDARGGLRMTFLALAIDPLVSGTMYVGKMRGGIFKSTNRGAD